MKYEIIKGSEKDFEGAPESATVCITENGFENDIPIFADKFENGSTRNHYYTGTYDSYIADVSNWTIIAERRPIKDPELRQIYGDVVHDDTDALQQRIDMGINFSDISGKIFSISKPLKVKPITEPVVNQQLTTEWDGEGLPPVGALCEYHANYIGSHAQYEECEIIAHFDGEGERLAAYVYTQFDGTRLVGQGTAKSFRPIRSPEDVARDEEIVLLTDVIFGKMPDAGMAAAAMFAGAVYDAGYRRPEPHADEVQVCEHKSTRPSAGGCICNDCGWRSW